ncbi:type II secretion system protein [Candidatus Peribacteria bacterium]|nr:type II secretion system protein [Candidatus Peribacteria bacterium]
MKSRFLLPGIDMRAIHHFRNRPGVTLIEMIIFIALVGVMAMTMLPMLFSATEARQRQDAIALVEQNGAQIMETIIQRVRRAERILDPPMGGTGFILALQMPAGETNPVIIARDSGAIVLVLGRAKRILSSDLVGVTHFAVDNTSVAEDRQSVAVTLGLQRTIRLHRPLQYRSNFTTVINVFPNDLPSETDPCGCPLPYCDTVSGTYMWHVCEDDLCVPYASFECTAQES